MRYRNIINKLSGTFITELPGVSSFHRLVHDFLIWKHQVTTVENRIEYNGVSLYANTSDLVARNLVVYGEYEPKISELINNHLTAGDFAIDIGGHIGHHSITMRQAVGNRGNVWIFEPNPKNADYLKKTIEENGWNNVELYPVALSDTESNDELLIIDSGNTGKAILNKESPQIEQERVMEQKYSVETKKLTPILNRENVSSVDLIKIDVEGGEYGVIKDLEGFLNNIKVIILEFHPSKLSQKEIQETLHLLDDNGELFDLNYDPIKRDRARKERTNIVWKSNKLSH